MLSENNNKKHIPSFPAKVYIYLYRKVSVHCTISAEHLACQVQHQLFQFLGLFCCPWRNVWRQTTHQLEASCRQRQSDRKYTKISHFRGCEMLSWQHLDVIWAEMLFTNFFVVQNIALSAANHDICSGACFCKLRWRTMYMCVYIYIHTRYTPNLIAMLKMILVH